MRTPKATLSISLILLSTIHLSMNGYPWEDPYGILSVEDYTAYEGQTQPAIHSVPGDESQWESYNQWVCVPASQVTYGCFDNEGRESVELGEVERGGQGFYPALSVEYDGRFIQFESPQLESSEDCQEELDSWKRLIAGEPAFCVFAAMLPSEEKLRGEGDQNFSLWDIYGIKTSRGRIMAPVYEPESDH